MSQFIKLDKAKKNSDFIISFINKKLKSGCENKARQAVE